MSKTKCIGLLKSGKQCRYNLKEGFQTCKIHREQEPTELTRILKYCHELNFRCLAQVNGKFCLEETMTDCLTCNKHARNKVNCNKEKIISKYGLNLPERTWIYYLVMAKMFGEKFNIPKVVFINCLIKHCLTEYEKIATGLLITSFSYRKGNDGWKVLWRDNSGRHIIAIVEDDIGGGWSKEYFSYEYEIERIDDNGNKHNYEGYLVEGIDLGDDDGDEAFVVLENN